MLILILKMLWNNLIRIKNTEKEGIFIKRKK